MALVLAFVLFALWHFDSRRGFLPTSRRTICVDARASEPGVWQFSNIMAHDERDSDPPLPLDMGVIRLRFDEQTMGRVNPGEWTSWRSCTWCLIGVGDRSGWHSWGDRPDLRTPELDAELTTLLERDIIPTSPAITLWPEYAPDPLRHSGDFWIIWQHNVNVPRLLVVVAVCLSLGSGLSLLLFQGRPAPSEAGTDTPQ